MSRETILVDGASHEIEVQPLTVICHTGELNVEVPGRFEISPDTTIATAKKLTVEQWAQWRAKPQFEKAWSLVWGTVPLPEDLSKCNMGMLHTVGLIILMVQCLWMPNAKPFIKLPETYLHPRQQTGLADLMIHFLNAHNAKERNEENKGKASGS